MKPKTPYVAAVAITSLAALACLAALATHRPVLATPAAAQVEVVFAGLRSTRGQVVASLCSAQDRFPDGCRQAQVVPATSGTVKLQFKGLAAGQYAIAAFHDENGDGRLSMSPQGWPAEGFAFSNNAMGGRGVPDFKTAAFALPGTTSVALQLRYMR
jgi:uncharacterized protein (DUF2141 family)